MQSEDFHSPYLSGSRLFRALDRNGAVLMEAPPLTEDLTLEAMPRHVAGAAAFRAGANAVLLPPSRAQASADTSAYSTLANPIFPPPVRGIYLPPDAPSPLAVDLLDSWNLLTESATRSADFHGNLFSRLRMMRFQKSVWIAPTFSIRAGNFIFAQPGRIGPKDKIGERVNNWFANRSGVRVEVAPGQVLLLNNHRFGCRVQGNSGACYQSWQIWTRDAFSPPPGEQDLELADAFRRKLKTVVESETGPSAPLFGHADASPEDLLRGAQPASRSPEEVLAAFKRVFLALEQS